MPFFIPALIAGGIAAAGAIGGGIASAVGSSNAANAQKDSAEKAMDLQREIYAQQQRNYEQGREDMRPWLEAGRGTLGELMAQMQGGYFDRQFDASQLANDPGFQFRMQQGQQALERSASARGLLNSGGALKSLQRYSQGLASDEFQNAWGRNQEENRGRFNRMAGIAGVGQQAAGTMGNMGAQNSAQMGQFANSMSGLYGAQGNASAAQHMGTANAVSGGFNTLGSLAMMGMGGYGGMGGGWGGGMDIPQQSGMGGAMGGGGMVSGSGSGAGWNPYSYR